MTVNMTNSERLRDELDNRAKMEKCILALLDISNSSDQSEDEIIQLIIDEATELTKSECGYLHLFNPVEQTIQLKVWSKRTLEHCTVVHDNHYPLTSAGIWADCARTKKPVIHNDYETAPNRKGLPEGHFKLIRHMSVPVIENDQVVVIIGVGNKATNYDELDVKQMEVITQNLWRLIKNKRYEQESKLDYLTGVLNRKEFEIKLNQTIKTNIISTLAYIDVDNFKMINDSGGHALGDQVLKSICEIFKTTTRSTDIIGRIGGDEFGIIFTHCNLSQSQKICDTIKFKINQLEFGSKLKIGVSIGLSLINESALSNADSACYLAKNGGKNQIKIYEVGNQFFSESKTRAQLASKIPSYIYNDQLKLFVQPIVDMNNIDHFNFFEVLLRIQEDDQLHSPFQFLAAAEQYKLSIEIDQWVVANILDLIPYLDHCFSINLSAQSISDRDFFDYLKFHLKKINNPHQICFEITESAAISNHNNAVELVRNLRKLGCRFALDDFGTGFSSFSYLKEFPVDYIKIDGMFVKDIAKNEFSKIICKSIKDIADFLKIQSIAEFVEDRDCLNTLQELSINHGQGYYFAKPFSIDDLLHYV